MISFYVSQISVGNIGELYKIRVAHDNAGDYPGWFCDEVRMRDIHTQEELIFDCRRWLSRDEEDAEICRELPTARTEESILPSEYGSHSISEWGSALNCHHVALVVAIRPHLLLRAYYTLEGSRRDKVFSNGGLVNVMSVTCHGGNVMYDVILPHTSNNAVYCATLTWFTCALPTALVL